MAIDIVRCSWWRNARVILRRSKVLQTKREKTSCLECEESVQTPAPYIDVLFANDDRVALCRRAQGDLFADGRDEMMYYVKVAAGT